jgi:PASTA domain
MVHPVLGTHRVDPTKRVDKLRSEYERALARSDARGAAYHQAVLRLLEGGGPELRGLAEELGLASQRPRPAQLREQALIANPPRLGRRRSVRAAIALCAVLAFAALTVAALWVEQVPPFVPSVRVPPVMGMREAAAIQRLEDAGLHVRLVRYRRGLPGVAPHSVVGVSHPAGSPAAGERLAKGSTVTLYIVGGRSAKKPPGHS